MMMCNSNNSNNKLQLAKNWYFMARVLVKMHIKYFPNIISVWAQPDGFVFIFHLLGATNQTGRQLWFKGVRVVSDAKRHVIIKYKQASVYIGRFFSFQTTFPK